MTYKKKNIVIALLTIVAFGIFVYSRTKGFHKSPFETITQSITYPFIYLSSTISNYTKKLISQRYSYKQLVKKYHTLQRDNNRLQKMLIILSASLHHYKKTNNLREFQERYKLTSATLAKILSRNFSQQEHYFIIDKGSSHGITPDMIAIYKLQIIGRVVDVSPFYSKIMCITDQHCKIASFTNSTSAQGILVGSNTVNQCTLSYVSHLNHIQKNDLVFSSGQGTIFPEGFCVGKISKHKLEKKALYHEITIRPLVDLKTIDYCLLTNQAKINLYK